VFAVAGNSHGTVAMAINVSISYLKAVTEGTLYAEAKEMSLNPKLGTYHVTVTNEAGELVATFQGMTYRKKDPIPGIT
jgi:acyl-CoA thioesterase